MASIIVSNIPEFSERADVVRCIQQFVKPNQLDYVLYPLGKEKTRALASFTSKTAADGILQKTGYLFGARLNFRPAPQQVYTRCSAMVDPTVAASINDIRQLVRQLRSEFGLAVSLDDSNRIVLTGSLPQIECAQLKLDQAHHELQARQRQEMLLLGQDLDTPRSIGARSPQIRDQRTPSPEDYQAVKHFSKRATSHMSASLGTKDALFLERSDVELPDYKQSAALRDSHDQLSRTTDKYSVTRAPATYGNDKYHRDEKTYNRLSASGSGGLPMTMVSLSFVADAFLMEYIRQIHWEDIETIEESNKVRISYEREEDLTTVRLRPSTYYEKSFSEEGEEETLAIAKKSLVGLYQTVYYGVVKERLRYNPSEVDIQKVEASVSAVRTAFATTAVISCRKPGEIVVVGNSDSVVVIIEWIASKLSVVNLDMPALTMTGYANKERGSCDKQKNRLAATWTAPEKSVSSKMQPTDVSYSGRNVYMARGPLVDDRQPASMPNLSSNAATYHSLEKSKRLKCKYEYETAEGLQVKICQGDIASLSVDVVVNPANENLELLGGVSGALKKAGGIELQKACDRYIQRNGPLKVTEVTSTRAVGTMKCSHVLHVVGPMWNLYTNKDHCARMLYQTIYNCLHHANNQLQARRLAIPPVSAGIYGVPLDVCMGTLHQALRAFSEEVDTDRTIKEVIIVTLDPDAASTAAVILQQLHQKYDNVNDSRRSSNLSAQDEEESLQAVTNIHIHSESMDKDSSRDGSQGKFGDEQLSKWEDERSSQELADTADEVLHFENEAANQRSPSPPAQASPLPQESPAASVDRNGAVHQETSPDDLALHQHISKANVPDGYVEKGTDVPGPSLVDSSQMQDVSHTSYPGSGTQSPRVASNHYSTDYHEDEATALEQPSPVFITAEQQSDHKEDDEFVMSDDEQETTDLNESNTDQDVLVSQANGEVLPPQESQLLEAFSPTHSGIGSPRQGSLHGSAVLESGDMETSSTNKRSTSNEMASAVPLLIQLLANGYCIAERASDLIRNILKQGELGVVEKGLNDLQTEADRSADRCITACFRKNFPGIALVSEEDEDVGEIPEDWLESSQSDQVLQYDHELPEDLRNIAPEDVVIWVDPLDGTSEYTIGLLDHVTVLIGIAVKGQAVAGIISQPYFNYQNQDGSQIGRVIWGVVGIGAFGLDQRTLNPSECIVATSRSHSNDVVEAAIKAVEPTSILRVGGSGHKVLLILEGNAHVYIFASAGCKKWDTCAPEAVLRAMGGILTDLHGNSYQYFADVGKQDTGGVLATPEVKDHQFYLQKMPHEILEQLKTQGPAPWQQ